MIKSFKKLHKVQKSYIDHGTKYVANKLDEKNSIRFQGSNMLVNLKKVNSNGPSNNVSTDKLRRS